MTNIKKKGLGRGLTALFWDQKPVTKKKPIIIEEKTMNSKEIFAQIKEHWDAFEANHNKFIEKGNKAAGGRARKAIGEIKKLVTEYRKASVAESK